MSLTRGSKRLDWREAGRKLRARVRKLAKRQFGNDIESRLSNLRFSRLRRWAAQAFGDFVATDGDRETMLSSLAMHLGSPLKYFENWMADDGKGPEFAESVLNACAQIDDETIWHKDLNLRSYVDVSIQIKTLRIFVDYLSVISGDKRPVDSLTITTLLLDHSPNSRIALLVHAEILLERGEFDSAIETIQKALRVQAVCGSAQQLLFRTYQAKREAGSTDDALKVLDYDLTDKFCLMPFTYLSTGWRGSAYLCSCPAWMPFSVGNVLTAETVDSVLNSEAAIEMRRSILDGDFSYCSRTLCSFITAQKLPTKEEIEDPLLRSYIDNHTTTITEPLDVVELNHDTTCNLACPSCRTGILAASVDEQDAYAQATVRVILPLLKRARGSYISGGGEAFASKHYRSILSDLNRQDYPHLYLQLMTNAQLVTPQKWNAFPDLAEMIGTLSVSIDAAKAETYERLRWPGKWATLIANLEFIAELRRSGKIRYFGLNFVVQKANYREMLDFVELGARLGVDQIWFQRAINYGAYDEATFAEIDVTSPQHPEHSELLEILRHPLLRGPLIRREMLMFLLPEVVASKDERLEYLYRSSSHLLMP